MSSFDFDQYKRSAMNLAEQDARESLQSAVIALHEKVDALTVLIDMLVKAAKPKKD